MTQNTFQYLRIGALSAAVMLGLGAVHAQTVLFAEDFNKDYAENFPFWKDFDQNEPNSAIASLFYTQAGGIYMPWWVLRDTKDDPDRFLGSHSYYTTPGQSNDWIITREITIPTAGFVLEFDAQSVNLRDLTASDPRHSSDLWLYIWEWEVNEQNVPTEAAKVWSKVPTGPSLNGATGEWTHYTFELDDWEGKTVRLCFVNQNFDKDLLCIDNIKVWRNDVVKLDIESYDTLITTDGYTVTATATVDKAGGVDNWKLTITDGTESSTIDGAHLENAETCTLSATFNVAIDTTSKFRVIFESEGNVPNTYDGEVTHAAFLPERRVLLEETTGLWCGNCPLGMYAIEALCDDEEIGEYVLPVSIHVSGASEDLMVMDEYAAMLGVTSQAPLVFINRNPQFQGFRMIDGEYNPTEEGTFANLIYQEQAKPTTLDVDVEGEWVIENGDTVAIDVKARLRSGLTMPSNRYRVGFILTENNVGLDNNPWWVQSNYLSGEEFESNLGGWTLLGDYVLNMRYHYVSRMINSFYGVGSYFPDGLEIDKDYFVKERLDVPTTYQENKDFGMIADNIHREMCEVTVFVIDTETELVANAARVAMSEKATKRYTAADAGIESVLTDSSATTVDLDKAVLYDMQGRMVNRSEAKCGLYIARDGVNAAKVFINE